MNDADNVRPEPEDDDAVLNGGQADYGSAGQQAAEGVNDAKPDAGTDEKPAAGNNR